MGLLVLIDFLNNSSRWRTLLIPSNKELFSSSFYVVNFVNECVEGIKDPRFAAVYEVCKPQ